MQWRLLEGVPVEQVQELLKVAHRRRFSRNEVVFHRDDPGDSLHLIQTGRFAVRVMTPLGDTATIAVRGPGDSFGEMALIAEVSRRSATVAAVEAAETMAVYRVDFEQVRKRNPLVDAALYRFLTDEVRMLNDRLLEALYMPVDKRVRRRLAELAELYTDDRDEPTVVPLTQETIAELAGATRSTSTRCYVTKRGAGRSSSPAARSGCSTSPTLPVGAAPRPARRDLLVARLYCCSAGWRDLPGGPFDLIAHGASVTE